MSFFARTDLVRTAAVTFLVADAFALVCVPLILLSERNLIPLPQALFHGSQWLACAVGFVSAAAFLWLGRGRARGDRMTPDRPRGFHDGRAIRVLAWLTVIGAGLWIALVVAVIVSMMLYYDGSY